MREIARLLGRRINDAVERQTKNRADQPWNSARVDADTQRLIREGQIDADGTTARVRRAATRGRFFQQMERDNSGVCMDDVTPFDK